MSVNKSLSPHRALRFHLFYLFVAKAKPIVHDVVFVVVCFLFSLPSASECARVLASERPSVDRYTGGLTPFSFHSVGHSTIRDPIKHFAVHCRRRTNIYLKEKVSKCVHASNFIFVWIIYKSCEQNRTFKEIVVPKIEFFIINGKFQIYISFVVNSS